jgi:coenzyme F420-reducing hydrogenase beta subunit
VPTRVSGKLFRYAVLSSQEAVSQAAKSAYYPVELSSVVHEIENTDGKCAVVGVPCFLKGLRLAMRTNRRLRNRIGLLAGLVCGQTKSTFYAEYLCTLARGDPRRMTDADFRVKEPTRHASDYGFRAWYVTNQARAVSDTLYRSEGCDEVWNANYFTPTACGFCDDLFAEVADVAFMDAWLPQYVADSRGTSIVLCRSDEVHDLLLRGSDQGLVAIEPIEVDRVIQSQAGGLVRKRDDLAHRLHLARSMASNDYYPRKRVDPRRYPSLSSRWRFRLRERMRLKSREAFSRRGSAGDVQSALLVELSLFRCLTHWRRWMLFLRRRLRPLKGGSRRLLVIARGRRT